MGIALYHWHGMLGVYKFRFAVQVCVRMCVSFFFVLLSFQRHMISYSRPTKMKLMVCILISNPIEWTTHQFFVFNRKFQIDENIVSFLLLFNFISINLCHFGIWRIQKFLLLFLYARNCCIVSMNVFFFFPSVVLSQPI